MRRALSIVTFLAVPLSALIAEPEYSRAVSHWQEIFMPSRGNLAEYLVWSNAAGRSQYEWRVFADGGEICAERITPQVLDKQRRGLKFVPEAGEFHGASEFVRVDDGWVVAFNEGEFGAALYWFSPDGQHNYKISDHKVVGFFSLSDGLHAIEGLAHMGVSEGSIIRIARPQAGARWQATAVTKLPFAPFAVSVRHDGTMLITLSDSLVSVGENRKINTLLADPPWGEYPNSSVLSPDEQKLYIGTRQFVGEFDIPRKKLRLLIPSNALFNKLPKEDEERIRKYYGG